MSSSKPSTVSFPLLSYQPLSLLYRLAKIISILVRLPIWLLRAAVPALRPDKSWTFKQTIMRTVFLHVVDMTSTVGITEPLSLAPGKEQSRWVTIEPFEDTLYVGPLLSTTVRPATTGGTWYGVPAAPDADAARSWTKVAMHIHGGAFVLGDGRSAATGFLGRTFVEHARFDAVFAPQYRLSGYGGRDPFPAALQDALTCYLYLVRTLDVSPRAITISGDSAGGNLAVALLRYLERFGARLDVPRPGRAVLVSPWVQPSAALRTAYDSWDLARTDFLPASFIRWGAEAYLLQARHAEGGLDVDDDAAAAAAPGDKNEWVDALGHPFATRVPVFLTWADKEILSVDCEAWAREMRSVGDGEWYFVVNIEPNALHDTLLIGDQLGWEGSAVEVATAIAKFVEDTSK